MEDNPLESSGKLNAPCSDAERAAYFRRKHAFDEDAGSNRAQSALTKPKAAPRRATRAKAAAARPDDANQPTAQQQYEFKRRFRMN